MLEVLHHQLCPYSRVVRVALSEKNLSFKLQEEKYWQRRDEFLAINPEGHLPVLLTDNGKTVCGAYAITEFLEENYDARGLIGRQALQRAETRRLISWFGNKFYTEVTKNLTWEKYFKKLEERGYPDSKALSAGRNNIFYHLDYIAYLTQNRRFLNSDEFTLADIFAACQLSVLDYFGDVPWEHNPHTKAWYQQIKNRPSFRPLLEDRVAGSNPVKWYAEVA